MKYVICALLALSLTACNDSKSDNNTPNANGPTVNETDYSVCGTYTPAGYDIQGNWQVVQRKGDVRIVMTIGFSRNVMSVTADCSIFGRSVRANVSSQISYTSNYLQIYRSDSDTQEISDNNGNRMSCTANVSASSMNYTFKGQCLVFSQGGQEMMLVPR